MSVHPKHEVARIEMATRLARLFYDNQFSSDFLAVAGDRFWKEVPRSAGEKHNPSPETRHLTLELLKDMEAKRPPRGPSLEQIAGDRAASSWGTPAPDTVSDGPTLPNPEQRQDLPVSVSGPSDSSEAPAAGTQGREGSFSSPSPASVDARPPAGIGLSESPRGGQVSLPPFQVHSETSRAAAESVANETAAMRLRVLQFIRDNPGCTDEEIAEGTGLPPNTSRPRRVELMQRNFVGVAGRKVTKSGRKANTWAIREVKTA